MNEQVLGAPGEGPGTVKPTPVVAVAIPIGIATTIVTVALTIKAGPVSFAIPAVLGAALVLIIRRRLALFGLTHDGTLIVGGIATGLAALFAFSGLQVAAQQKERDHAVRQIVALGQSDPAAQQARIAKFDEPLLASLKKIAPALEAQERARRAREVEREKVRVEVASAEQKRGRIVELERELGGLSRTDYESRAQIYRELHDLAPSRQEYGKALIDLAADRQKFNQVHEHPEYSLIFSKPSWQGGGFGSVMLINADVKNVSEFTLKDFMIECTTFGASGTELNTASRIVYERIKPSQTKRLREFNMGFLANQAATTSCRIVGAVIEE